ncbi:MAG: hypothetical protein RI572_13605, partial [Salegentibacter sp.]
MIPTDHEFSLLYMMYGMLLAFLIIKAITSDYKMHLIFLSIYTAFLIFIFSDRSNFEGGSSLGVLLLGASFVGLQLLIIITIKIYKELRKT